MSSKSDNPFWDFSLLHYDTPGVADICLGLQDRCGLSVNILLYGLWLASRGRVLGLDIVERNEALRQCHEQVLAPLRSARYGMKRIGMNVGQPKLYFNLKQAELKVEKVEQKLLFRMAPDMPHSNEPVRSLALQNLQAYLRSAGVDPAQCSDEIQRLIDLVLEDKGNVFFSGGKD